jgi:hypothetical protein
MEPDHWLLITALLWIIRQRWDLDYEAIVRQVERSGLQITARDVREAIDALCPGEDWGAQEQELCHILRI